MVQAFQEALEVAEALVLLPGVDSVTPGRQLFTRAAARDLQVSLGSPWFVLVNRRLSSARAHVGQN